MILHIDAWCLHIEQPQAQHPPTSTPLWQSTSPPEVWDLRVSDASWCAITEWHKITIQNVFIHRSWLVEWTSHPHPECWIPDNFQVTPENSSLPSPRLTGICSEQCLEICITSTSYVCLTIYNVLLIVFLSCKSVWIKASAKWINVNVTSVSPLSSNWLRWKAQKGKPMSLHHNANPFWAQCTIFQAADGPSRFSKIGTGGPVWHGMSSSTYAAAQSVPCWRRSVTSLGKLVPLPVSHRPWSHIEIDFVTDLPNSDGNTWITSYSIHESPHSRSIQVELGNLEGFWSTLGNCYNKH